MHIDSYSFGKIVIDGKPYGSDVIVFPDRVQSNWWRKEGHNLSFEDLDLIIEYKPDTIIIGRGASGVMKVSEEIIKQLEDEGYTVHAPKSNEACKLFNELIAQDERVVLGIHLTC